MTIDNLKKGFEEQRNIIQQINALTEELRRTRDESEKKMIMSQIENLKAHLKTSGEKVKDAAERVSVIKPLPKADSLPLRPVQQQPTQIQPQPQPQEQSIYVNPSANEHPEMEVSPITLKQPPITIKKKKEKLTELEKLSLKRMKHKKVKVVKKKEKKPNPYVKMASTLFYKRALNMINKGRYKGLRRDLIKGNLEFVPASYISVIFFTTILSFVVAMILVLFFLFFSIIATPPFIVRTTTNIIIRFLQVFWLIFVIPIVVFVFLYFYPSMEKRSIENRINIELPFVVIHMSSISNSMIEPSKIFQIIMTTKEYPYLDKEFTKLINEINIYGYDLVTALRNMAFNCPSKKLAEVYNGLATTITSGGNLPEFFDKRSQTLLFDHRLEREKQTKAAETFMDIYISVVIAAPMILMLLLMMMRISGLGLSLSTSMITLTMILGVSMINILFIAFLHLKQPEGG